MKSADLAELRAMCSRLLTGCQVTADDGTVLYTPDGLGNYRALWTRDFAYMVESAGDLIPDAHVIAGFRFLLAGQRDDGAMPDRVYPNGQAVWVAGPQDRPIGRANLDNPMFMVFLAAEVACRLPAGEAAEHWAAYGPALARGLDWVPLSAVGLVENDPADPHSPYGFTDTIGKTGELAFESVLYWQACRLLVDAGIEPHRFGQAADRVVSGMERLWYERTGCYLAATVDCRQPDVWANAFALHLGMPLARAELVRRWLVETVETYAWRGQIRHLPAGLHWERTLTGTPPETYQNGAYWATATGWVLNAVWPTAPELATRLMTELMADLRQHGIHECVNVNDYRKLDSYVVSATNPYGVAKRLWGG